MSNIFDKNLIKQLLKIAQETADATDSYTLNPAKPSVPATPIKTPTPQPETIPQQKDYYGVNDTAKKLVSKLKQYMEDFVQIESESNQPTKLLAANLKNLSSFLIYLKDNQILVNGEKVIYSKDEFDKLDQEKRNEIGALSYDTGQKNTPDQNINDQNQSKHIVAEIFVDKQRLIDYLKYLQQKAFSDKNKVLEVQVGKLLIQAKQQGIDHSIDPKRSTPEQPTIDASTVVDSMPQAINESTYLQDGPFNLTSGDLSNKDALSRWLDKNQIKFGKGMQQAKENICSAIQWLYKRAFAKAQQGKPNKEISSYYLKRITELAPTFVDNEGKACSLQTSQPTPGTNGQQPSSKPSGPNYNQMFAALLAALPLEYDKIDFTAIANFAQVFKNAFQSSEQYKSKITAADNIINTVSKIYQNYLPQVKPDNQPIQSSSSILNSLVTNSKQRSEFSNYVNALINLVEQTRTLLTDLESIVAAVDRRYQLFERIQTQKMYATSNVSSLQAFNARPPT